MAEQAAAERAGFGVEIYDAEDDPRRQLSQMRLLLAHGARAMIVSATRPDAVDEALDECLAAGVPVVGESIELDHPAVVAEVRVDDVAAGIELGRAVGSALPDDRVSRLTMVGHASLAVSHDRERGFLEGFRATHPDIMATYVDGRAQVDLARRATRRVLQRVGAAESVAPDVLFGVDDESVLGARMGYADAGVDISDVVTATYGISPPDGPEHIDDGTIGYGAAMFPEWHGEILVRLAVAAIRHQPHERLVNPAFAVVTASGTPLGWDRFYRRDGGSFELVVDAVAALR
jgi:ribose transport system substrate-binding protein